MKIDKILVIRNDKLGDFMLSFPSFGLLKQALPDAEMFALVPNYTRPLATECKWIDQIIIDPGPNAPLRDQLKMLQQIKQNNFSAAISLFSTTRIGLALFLARIPYRLAPATKVAQVFYNHRLIQRRSLSEKPEHEYNTDLIQHFLIENGFSADSKLERPFLLFDTKVVADKKQHFLDMFRIGPENTIIFIHPGSGGSANNLSVGQYAKLAQQLCLEQNARVIITAGPGELSYAKKLSDLIDQVPHHLYQSTTGLLDFAQHIQFADLFISGSTGPLHIAGALDTPTVAFYPRRRSATALRWQTLNSLDKRLAFSPPTDNDVQDMSAIDVVKAAQKIKTLYSFLFN